MARLGQWLKARRDVDAVSIEVAALHYHIAQIDPDAQHDPAVLRQSLVRSIHCALQPRRRPH
jgi:hypothetical protein